MYVNWARIQAHKKKRFEKKIEKKLTRKKLLFIVLIMQRAKQLLESWLSLKSCKFYLFIFKD